MPLLEETLNNHTCLSHLNTEMAQVTNIVLCGKLTTRLFYIINPIAVDIATQGAVTSAAVALTWYTQDIPV